MVQTAKSLTITEVKLKKDRFSVLLSDEREILVPFKHFPRLAQGSPSERDDFYLIGGGSGIHWEQLDEDIGLKNILDGKRSGESQTSFKKWQQERQNSKPQ